MQVQILAWVLSYNPANNVDSLALLASSAALLASPIPFDTPIAGVAVGMDSEGNFVVNPTREALRFPSAAAPPPDRGTCRA
jgi:polyribonucleotide nucleotidyltransferase